MVVVRKDSGEVDMYMNRRLMLRRVVTHLRTTDLQKGGQYEGG